jgi:hypothetical protein
MPTAIAQAFIDANSATVLVLQMLETREPPEYAIDARLRARVATFVAPARAPADGVVLQAFVIRRGEELLGWVRPTIPTDSCSFDAVRSAIEAAIGESLQEFVLSLVDRGGTYVATRIGRSSSTRTCAEVAAVVAVQCGWDESPVLEVTIDGERFALRATYDDHQQEWLFESASPTQARSDQ